MSDHFLVRCQWNGLLPRPPQLRHLLSQEIMPAAKHAVWVCNISAVSALRGPQSVSNDMGQHPVPEEPGLVPDPVTAWEGDNRAALEEGRVAPSVLNRPDVQVYCWCIKNRWEQNQLGYSHVSQREGAVCIVFHQTVNDDWGWGGLMFLCCSTITYFDSTVWFTCAESNRNFALCHYSVGKIYKWTMLNYLHFTCTEPHPHHTHFSWQMMQKYEICWIYQGLLFCTLYRSIERATTDCFGSREGHPQTQITL